MIWVAAREICGDGGSGSGPGGWDHEIGLAVTSASGWRGTVVTAGMGLRLGSCYRLEKKHRAALPLDKYLTKNLLLESWSFKSFLCLMSELESTQRHLALIFLPLCPGTITIIVTSRVTLLKYQLSKLRPPAALKLHLTLAPARDLDPKTLHKPKRVGGTRGHPIFPAIPQHPLGQARPLWNPSRVLGQFYISVRGRPDPSAFSFAADQA